METKTLDYAKCVSVNALASKTIHHFDQFSVMANTVFNNGIIKTAYENFHNKCFFIALSDALRDINIIMEPIQIASICHMKNNIMMDTDNPAHVVMIHDLADKLHATIEIYVAKFKPTDKKWYTTPTPSVLYGNGKRLLRILNKGHHFEYLLSLDHGFINRIDKELHNVIIGEQTAILETLEESNKKKRVERQIENDREFAKRLTNEEWKQALINVTIRR